MDTLKGKQIMVWTFMGNARMYEALRDYGDRISQIGLFSFKVRATGEIYESGVAISDMLTYINKWPHIKWLLTVANDGANSIFRALRDNTDGAQDRFLSEIVRIMEKYPWCDGIDIDLERGDGYSTHTESTAMFCNIALRSPLRSLPLRGNAAVAERKWASAHAARCGHRKPDGGCAVRRRRRGAVPCRALTPAGRQGASPPW